LDVGTIDDISKHHPECKFYVPLGNKSWFKLSKPLDSQGNDRVMELDWWESANIERANGSAELKFTCTPCQHFSGRGLFDRNKTLWASWCIEGLVDGKASAGKVFFGG
jgi:N-acyl-phosphatidylethanolamine-hydrolysing phospholipase D